MPVYEVGETWASCSQCENVPMEFRRPSNASLGTQFRLLFLEFSESVGKRLVSMRMLSDRESEQFTGQQGQIILVPTANSFGPVNASSKLAIYFMYVGQNRVECSDAIAVCYGQCRARIDNPDDVLI